MVEPVQGVNFKVKAQCPECHKELIFQRYPDKKCGGTPFNAKCLPLKQALYMIPPKNTRCTCGAELYLMITDQALAELEVKVARSEGDE
ncbi:hypothetical protein DRO66_02390 [Candidatus Bathyarchaeota archaeon]|nr:MAG: hypothetical protein DRO66_02390 [Candidatus Bathyarchaeota archaeon]